MAISTYAELKQALSDYPVRSDLAPFVDTFIDLAEARFNRELRTRQMVTTATLSPDENGQATLPNDYRQWVEVKDSTTPHAPLVFMTVDAATDKYPSHYAANPAVFTIVGDTLTVYPKSTSDLVLTYYEQIPALSDSQTTNWLLTLAPDLYLFECLKHLNIFIQDVAKAQAFGAQAEIILNDIVIENERSQYSRAGVTLPVFAQ